MKKKQSINLETQFAQVIPSSENVDDGILATQIVISSRSRSNSVGAFGVLANITTKRHKLRYCLLDILLSYNS